MTQAKSRTRTLPYWLMASRIAFLITRLVVFAGAYLSDVVLMVTNDEPRGAIGIWNCWDSLWYSDIVDKGYNFDPAGKSPVAFSPLYPFLISIVKPVCVSERPRIPDSSIESISIGRRLGAGYVLSALLSALLLMFSRTASMIRYILVVFPVFMMAGRWGRSIWMNRIWRIVCLPFLALFTALFVKGVFIG